MIERPDTSRWEEESTETKSAYPCSRIKRAATSVSSVSASVASQERVASCLSTGSKSIVSQKSPEVKRTRSGLVDVLKRAASSRSFVSRRGFNKAHGKKAKASEASLPVTATGQRPRPQSPFGIRNTREDTATNPARRLPRSTSLINALRRVGPQRSTSFAKVTRSATGTEEKRPLSPVHPSQSLPSATSRDNPLISQWISLPTQKPDNHALENDRSKVSTNVPTTPEGETGSVLVCDSEISMQWTNSSSAIQVVYSSGTDSPSCTKDAPLSNSKECRDQTAVSDRIDSSGLSQSAGIHDDIHPISDVIHTKPTEDSLDLYVDAVIVSSDTVAAVEICLSNEHLAALSTDTNRGNGCRFTAESPLSNKDDSEASRPDSHKISSTEHNVLHLQVYPTPMKRSARSRSHQSRSSGVLCKERSGGPKSRPVGDSTFSVDVNSSQWREKEALEGQDCRGEPVAHGRHSSELECFEKSLLDQIEGLISKISWAFVTAFQTEQGIEDGIKKVEPSGSSIETTRLHEEGSQREHFRTGIAEQKIATSSTNIDGKDKNALRPQQEPEISTIGALQGMGDDAMQKAKNDAAKAYEPRRELQDPENEQCACSKNEPTKDLRTAGEPNKSTKTTHNDVDDDSRQNLAVILPPVMRPEGTEQALAALNLVAQDPNSDDCDEVALLIKGIKADRAKVGTRLKFTPRGGSSADDDSTEKCEHSKKHTRTKKLQRKMMERFLNKFLDECHGSDDGSVRLQHLPSKDSMCSRKIAYGPMSYSESLASASTADSSALLEASDPGSSLASSFTSISSAYQSSLSSQPSSFSADMSYASSFSSIFG